MSRAVRTIDWNPFGISPMVSGMGLIGISAVCLFVLWRKVQAYEVVT